MTRDLSARDKVREGLSAALDKKAAAILVFNLTGGVAWILSFLIAGWWFGGREIVQKNFKLVILAIIVISILPAAIEFLRKRNGRRNAPDEKPAVLETSGVGEER